MFEIQRFVEECRAAQRADGPMAVQEVVARAVSDPWPVMDALGEPRRGGIQGLHVSDDLTVLNIVWPPWMTLLPHDHRMWAVIGIYTGREDNVFWRRVRGDAEGRVEAAGARAFSAKQAVPLGRDVIHSVTNPIPRFTGAIHVYGGDFFATPRSAWDPETLVERPYDVDGVNRIFEDANRRAEQPRPAAYVDEGLPEEWIR